MQGITGEHPEYVSRRNLLETYGDLYAGGDQLQSNIQRYLLPRQKEPFPIWQDRCSRAFYDNYIGSIIDWYGATLFRREPLINLEEVNKPTQTFYATFNEDCDRRGTSLTDFFRQRFIESLVFGSSHILVDFPQVGSKPRHHGEEIESGASRAYLVGYSPESLVNWSKDDEGNYEWVVLRTSHQRKERPDDPTWIQETRWYYYDRQAYKVYRSKRHQGETDGREQAVELVAEGLHGLARLNKVPLFDLRHTEGMWLMNKAASLQLEHFNKSNALAYAIHIGLFAMPVVYTDKEFDQPIGESYYVMLGQNDRFGWTEPQGNVYNIAASNIERLQQEIYRVSYLLSQSGGTGGATPQSGLSKVRDYLITMEVLRAYGDGVKDVMRRVIRSIRDARADGATIEVAGLDEFDIGEFSEELSQAERLLAIGIESPTLIAQVKKRLAMKYLCDSRQDIKDRIALEIDQSVQRGPQRPGGAT